MRIAALLCWLGAAALQAQTPVIRNPHTTAADALAGAKIFRSHCADCHGLNGEGGKGPNLTTGVYYHGGSDAALFKTVTDGVPGTPMPGVFFSADQVWQIVTHLRALARTGTHKAPPGNAAAGQQLFVTKGCAGCHLAAGVGGTNGPDLSYIGSQRPVAHLRQAMLDPNAHVDKAFWPTEVVLENGTTHRGFLLNEDTYYVQMLTAAQDLLTLPRKDFRKFEVKKTSTMPSYQGKLSDAELGDLVAYLWTLQRPRVDEKGTR